MKKYIFPSLLLIISVSVLLYLVNNKTALCSLILTDTDSKPDNTHLPCDKTRQLDELINKKAQKPLTKKTKEALRDLGYVQ